MLAVNHFDLSEVHTFDLIPRKSAYHKEWVNAF